MTPAQDPKQKKCDFPLIVLEFVAKTIIFEVPRPSRVDWYQSFWISSLPDPFRYENMFVELKLPPKGP